ncbi:hypothetical protein IRJ41_012432 [Triplophysa rosa]|uniref:Gypsy retrotransposon integrase-like protein 1 n=1 Tax=Triplophysa rosa TaxID=992332 RepID=A0A9W7WI13_TRIRA|nr:hypothetical protein IRJ41_012432 [Triplophysa rosa]
MTKLTAQDDIEAYLHTFEVIATREAWDKAEWVKILAPFLTGEAQRAYVALQPLASEDYDALKREILARLGISPISVAQQFHQWSYEEQVPARAQAARLSRLGQLWLLAGEPSASQVAERVVVDWLLRALPRRCRMTEGTLRPVPRPAAPTPPDEPMPTEPSSHGPPAWLAGCAVHQAVPSGAPRRTVRVEGRPVTATLDSGSSARSRKERRPRPVLLATESEKEGESRDTNLFATLFQQITSGGSFGREQRDDPRLWNCWTQVRVIDGEDRQPTPHPLPHFVIKRGLLYCAATRQGEEKLLLVVPATKTATIMELAHTHPMAGHLAAANTIQRIRYRFHWPGLEGEVKRFCQGCPTCQLTSPQRPPPSPLIPLLVIEVPFERIGMDLVGPLPKSARGHEYILVILDYATRYPEALPLRKATSKAIAKELFLMFSRVGIPREVLTDQGTPFMSRLMADLCHLLQVKQLRTSVYHPQTDGLVERFNQTLKRMLRRVVAKDGCDWDLLLPYVLFGVREVPQASTGFTPFELLFGRQPRGLLDVAQDAWEQQPAPYRSLIKHVQQMRGRIDRVMPIVKEHLVEAQRAQKRWYDRPAQPREFQPGDRVLVLTPTATSKFLASWKGPYTVVEKVGPVNYRVHQPGQRREEQLYHVNLLKKWVATPAQMAAFALDNPPVVQMGEQLSPLQKKDLHTLVSQFQDVFSPKSGQTRVIQHEVRTRPGVVVRQRPYRVPEARRLAIEEEITRMQELGVIEPSRSPCSSPIVMVPKPDGTLRFFNDFRRLNEVSSFDSYPMPRVDELLDRLRKARFISTLDLTKGYWQVPLSPSSREKTAFSTPSGHWQYTMLPFGLHGAPATFQWMMDVLLWPHQAYAAAYIDDLVIHSGSWDAHLDRLRRVLLDLRMAGLMANPKKCHLGLAEAQYLGYRVGGGLIQPQTKKVEAVRDAP